MNATTDWLIAIAGRSAEGLVAWSWQALVLITCVWLGLKIFKVKSPALRHHIWMFSLIAIALLPSATEVARRFPAIYPASPLSQVIGVPRRVIELAPPPAPQNEPAVPARGWVQRHLQSGPSSLPLLPLLFVVWLAGALVVMARLIREQASLRRTRTQAKPIGAADLGVPMCPALITGKVSLRLSSEIDSPLLCGAFHPTILLPADITEWTSDSERSGMIQHELAHVERLDPFINLFQTALSVIFFFHPPVRYACRQIRLERELACDDLVVALGASAETYAEGLLKVAERSLAPGAGHQLAFFSAKQILERRIEMILNSNRVRAGARQWKFMVLSAGLIAAVSWLLIPAGSAQPEPGQSPTESSLSKLRVVKQLGDDKSYGALIEMALRNTDPELRRLAAVRLTELEGDGSTAAIAELYKQSDDLEVKIMLIETFARRSEMEPLTQIALSEPGDLIRLRALQRIKFLKENSESTEVRNWDVSALSGQLSQVSAEPPPPPPPPPAPRPIDRSNENEPPPPPPRPVAGNDRSAPPVHLR